MQSVHYPKIFAKGRWWSADEIEGMARRWHASAVEALRDHDSLHVDVTRRWRRIDDCVRVRDGRLINLALVAVRQYLARELPPWCWPRELVEVPLLPRLPGGKIDREACRRLPAGVDES